MWWIESTHNLNFLQGCEFLFHIHHFLKTLESFQLSFWIYSFLPLSNMTNFEIIWKKYIEILLWFLILKLFRRLSILLSFPFMLIYSYIYSPLIFLANWSKHFLFDWKRSLKNRPKMQWCFNVHRHHIDWFWVDLNELKFTCVHSVEEESDVHDHIRVFYEVMDFGSENRIACFVFLKLKS